MIKLVYVLIDEETQEVLAVYDTEVVAKKMLPQIESKLSKKLTMLPVRLNKELSRF